MQLATVKTVTPCSLGYVAAAIIQHCLHLFRGRPPESSAFGPRRYRTPSPYPVQSVALQTPTFPGHKPEARTTGFDQLPYIPRPAMNKRFLNKVSGENRG